MDWVLSGGFCYGDGEEVFMWALVEDVVAGTLTPRYRQLIETSIWKYGSLVSLMVYIHDCDRDGSQLQYGDHKGLRGLRRHTRSSLRII